jgi:4-amino-4-deoxy-L-arabinose transferase-like glycosyltransferase
MGTFQPPKLWGSGFVRPVAVMAGLTACAVLVRLPFLFNTGVDEAFYLVVAGQWLEGMPPYANSFDVKPPLLFALMAAAETAFGPNLVAAKALAMASVSGAVFALYLFGRRFLSERAGVTAALLYILSSLSLGGAFSPAELIMAPFTVFGMLLGFSAVLARRRPPLWPLFAAGFCLGAAASVKQTAIFEAAPLAAFLFFGRPLTDGFKAVVLLAAGFVVVPVGFALYFLADGHFGAFFADVAVAAAGRVSAPPVSLSDTVSGLLIGLLLMLPIIIMAAAAYVFPGRGPKSSALPFLAGWTAGALAGVLAARAALVIYFLPLLPPLCLTASAFLGRCGDRRQGRAPSIIAPTAIAAVTAYSAFFTAPLLFSGRDNLASANEAAAAMRSAGLGGDDRILVADRDLIVYLAAGANPPAGVFHPFHLLCGFPLPDGANALADSLRSRPAFIVAANPPYARPCEMPERRLLLDSALARDYCQLGRFGNTLTGAGPGSLVVYGLKARAAMRCL